MTAHQSKGRPADDGEALVASAVRQATRRLLPLLVLLYFVNYLDRVNIAFAGPNGMNSELGLTSTLFGVAAGVFFAGYLLLEVPSNLALHRFGARRWIARILITWGVVATAMAYVPDPTTLIVLRFLLGVAEAGFFPGIILYLTYWFPAAHRTRVTALFLTALPVSTALGAVLSTHIIEAADGLFGLSGWRVMFLLEGVPAVVLAVVTWCCLTEGPAQASWLSEPEREALGRRLRAERDQSASSGPGSVRKALTSGRVLTLAGVYFGATYGLYALSFFLPTIVDGFQEQFRTEYSLVERGLINAVPFAVAAVAMLLWSRVRLSDTVRVALPAALGGLAIPVTLYLSNPFLATAAVTVCACGVLCSIVGFWALPTSHLAGAAAAAGIGLINSLGNVSGFAAPYISGFLLDTTGTNRPALWAVGICMVLAALATVLLARSSRRRDPPAQPDGAPRPTHTPVSSR
ncbi:MFS transporter [Streptomyces sp. NPDC102384]|uniref:MFS transporter n=1 Tax=Streptomyces sp. NPDC102384 TaxID=3366166 RepID=UPI00381AF4DC